VSDHFNLQRFVDAQDGIYETALAELHAGRKRTHWMWFILPQLRGLGRSEMARFYGITGLEEAKAYLAHPLLGPRLRECVEALLLHAGRRSAEEILGPVDAMKLRSCLTLFESAGGGELFTRGLQLFFNGTADAKTLSLLAA
jgi:uncharacterized protein (DUF1810 family)